tara:strand:+ start:551 stop:862 length:312 start_codon:yes stop_codon:yes gene_type:complete
MTEDKADKGQWHGGKGSVQKPNDHDKYAENWDKIFKKDKGLSEREKVLMDPLAASQRSDAKNKTDKRPSTLQAHAWKRAIENSKPNAGTPHDWEDYEKQKDKE